MSDDHLKAAEEILELLNLETLTMQGKANTIPAHLRENTRIINGLNELGVLIPDAYFALENQLEAIAGEGWSIIQANPDYQAARKRFQGQIMDYPLSEVPGQGGDDIEAQLCSFVEVRLAFGKSNTFVEKCLELFGLGFWPFGWEPENETLLMFSHNAWD